jgi:hypothetical protein
VCGVRRAACVRRGIITTLCPGTAWRCQCAAAGRGYAGRLRCLFHHYLGVWVRAFGFRRWRVVLMRCCEAGCSADGGPVVADERVRYLQTALISSSQHSSCSGVLAATS